MAEALELDLKEISLLQFNQVKTGFIEMSDEDVNIFKNYNWKLFLSMIGFKMLDKYSNVIHGECIINFFSSDKEGLDKIIEKQNTTIMGEQVVQPLFYIKFNKDKHIELIDRKEEEIPKNIFFIIMCR